LLRHSRREDKLGNNSPRETPPEDKLQDTAELNRRDLLLSGSSLLAASALTQTCLTNSARAQPAPAQPAGGRKPNILVIMGDDIGWYNASIYHCGDMGYQTPNIDRIGKDGAIFTCWYGQQSCTAGRAAFITGQSPIRTGLTKVGLSDCRARMSGCTRKTRRSPIS
jgi:Sulfatase